MRGLYYEGGFRGNRSCTGQIAALKMIIIEQYKGWYSELVVNFLGFEKAFDSIDRAILWKIMRNYGITEKLVTPTRKMYEGTVRKVIHEGQLGESLR